MVQNNIERLALKLNYTFNDHTLLKQALTHCSAGQTNNERLEFLGDSILSFVIANALYEQFPEKSEGQLSRLRSHLVKGETLAQIAKEIHLGDYLLLGQGELKSGGFRRASILADALEAVFASVFLDGGINSCSMVILHLYRNRLNSDELEYNLKDSKTQLQEYLQGKKYLLPTYTLLRIEGEEHDQVFYVECIIPQLSLTASGRASNRRKAEQNAAKEILNQLELIDPPLSKQKL